MAHATAMRATLDRTALSVPAPTIALSMVNVCPTSNVLAKPDGLDTIAPCKFVLPTAQTMGHASTAHAFVIKGSLVPTVRSVPVRMTATVMELVSTTFAPVTPGSKDTIALC